MEIEDVKYLEIPATFMEQVISISKQVQDTVVWVITDGTRYFVQAGNAVQKSIDDGCFPITALIDGEEYYYHIFAGEQ